MEYKKIDGVPDFVCTEFLEKKNKYCIIIPIINEKENIKKQLERAKKNNISSICDIIICDGNSSDGSNDESFLKDLDVNTLLIKKGAGKQGAQLRMGFYWALNRGYEGILTVDGNNKDSIEDAQKFIDKLEKGYDFVQGSRYAIGGRAINTPKSRHLAVKYIHSPIISLTAKEKFTDSTNNFRAYSKRYLKHPLVQPFRDIFTTYELLAYLSTRASQLKLRTCEVGVTRAYPNDGKVPTKISPIKGNALLMKILIENAFGKYNP